MTYPNIRKNYPIISSLLRNYDLVSLTSFEGKKRGWRDGGLIFGNGMGREVVKRWHESVGEEDGINSLDSCTLGTLTLESVLPRILYPAYQKSSRRIPVRPDERSDEMAQNIAAKKVEGVIGHGAHNRAATTDISNPDCEGGLYADRRDRMKALVWMGKNDVRVSMYQSFQTLLHCG